MQQKFSIHIRSFFKYKTNDIKKLCHLTFSNTFFLQEFLFFLKVVYSIFKKKKKESHMQKNTDKIKVLSLHYFTWSIQSLLSKLKTNDLSDLLQNLVCEVNLRENSWKMSCFSYIFWFITGQKKSKCWQRAAEICWKHIKIANVIDFNNNIFHFHTLSIIQKAGYSKSEA